MDNQLPTETVEIPETKVCEKHGEYHVRVLNCLGRHVRFEKCAQCEDEARLADEEQKKEEERQHEAMIFNNALHKAGVSDRHKESSFNTYIADTEDKQRALDAAKTLSDIVASDRQGNLMLTGNVGTGKTHLASAIVRRLVKSKEVRLIRCIDLMRRLKDTWRKGSEVSELELIHHYGNIDLLIIDEIGIQFDSQTEKMFIFDVINARYENKKPLMLMSNLNKEGVIECLGEQAVDRLKEDGCPIIAMDWESERSKVKKDGN